MKCPYCNHKKTKVSDKRDTENSNVTRRRRECIKCKKRFTTYERPEALELAIVKKDNRREKFDKHKLLTGILKAVLFFVALPYFLTLIIGFKEESNPFLFNFIDGVIRILIFLAYVLGISFLKDVKRLFQYHGAEHMAVHCYENNKKLTIENIKKFPTLHPRCGTSFIMIVLLISILVFSILPPIVLYLFPGFANFNIIFRKIILFSLRISLIPLIAGISYELLKLSDKFRDNFMMNVFIQPGLWFQKITTKKPNKKQIEVARKSVMVLLNLK